MATMADLAHPCPICAAPAGEPCAVPRLPLCANGVHVERLYPRACPECGALSGVPCPDGHTHARRDPSPVDWRARAVRMWTAQGHLSTLPNVDTKRTES